MRAINAINKVYNEFKAMGGVGRQALQYTQQKATQMATDMGRAGRQRVNNFVQDHGLAGQKIALDLFNSGNVVTADFTGSMPKFRFHSNFGGRDGIFRPSYGGTKIPAVYDGRTSNLPVPAGSVVDKTAAKGTKDGWKWRDFAKVGAGVVGLGGLGVVGTGAMLMNSYQSQWHRA